VVTNDSIEELDFLDENLSNFKLSYSPGYYRVNSNDIWRPDLISYKIYGDVKYWWILLLYNGIDDPFNDIQTGDIMEVPNILDIYTFFKKFKTRL